MSSGCYTGLSLVSGTSLDGLDIAAVEFSGEQTSDYWFHRVRSAKTVPYPDEWRKKLEGAANLSGLELISLHVEYAHFMGEQVQEFLKDLEDDVKPQFVASQGHTVFHQPDSRLTFQLGDGETLATYLHWPLICNFRMKDIGLGGEGAPLAPSVERFLFGYVGLCLNLGGIANLGVRNQFSYDVCSCNTVLNRLAKMADPSVEFDEDGQLARKGTIRQEMLDALEKLDYYRERSPKSLSVQYINDNVWPILDEKKYSLEDMSRTYVEHIALQVVRGCDAAVQMVRTSQSEERAKVTGAYKVLITGGGAHNKTLMEVMETKLKSQKIVLEETDDNMIDFKEAVIFAFLGLRCLMGRANVFSYSTGARQSSISGSIHQAGLQITDTLPYYRKSHFRFIALDRQLSGPV